MPVLFFSNSSLCRGSSLFSEQIETFEVFSAHFLLSGLDSIERRPFSRVWHLLKREISLEQGHLGKPGFWQ